MVRGLGHLQSLRILVQTAASLELASNISVLGPSLMGSPNLVFCLSLPFLESCPGKLIEIQGKAGLFLEGQIHPELEGVEIVISEKGASSPLITVFTDDKGAYR